MSKASAAKEARKHVIKRFRAEGRTGLTRAEKMLLRGRTTVLLEIPLTLLAACDQEAERVGVSRNALLVMKLQAARERWEENAARGKKRSGVDRRKQQQEQEEEG